MKRHLGLYSRILIRLTAVFFLSSIASGASLPVPSLAQQPLNAILLQASIGFDGNLKPMTWAPVLVHLENSGPAVQGYVQVFFSDVDDKNTYRFPVELPAGAKKEIIVYAFVPSYAYEAEVAYYTRQQRLANTSLQISMRSVNDRLIGIAADTPSVFNVLNLVDPPNGDAYTAELDLLNLPESSLALESVDAIILSNIDSGQLSHSQVQALSTWVANGGRLVLFGGPEWQKTTARFTQSDLLPYHPTRTQVIDEWSAFSTLAPGQPELDGKGVAAIGNLDADADILAVSGSNLPLILRKNFGAGEVIFITVDPALAPLDGWPGMENFYRSILNRTLSISPWQNGINDWYSAANAAQTLPNLNLPPAALVCGFLVLYMVILGPVNYLVVRRLKRREVGWFTTTGLIVVFSLLVLISGGLSRSRQPILNRLAVLQVWPGAPLARLDSVLGIYSPFRGTYQLDFTGFTLAHGLPASNSPVNRGMVIYQNGSSGYISDLRVEVSSIQPVSLEGFVPAPKFDGSLKISIDSNGAMMVGSVTNLSEIVLEDAVLITSGGVVNLGSFKPGETREVSQALNRNLAMQPSLMGVYPTRPPVYSPSGAAIYPPAFSANSYAIEDIVGTNNFYSNRETYRKYSLVSSFYNNNVLSSIGNEIFLSGWSKQPILPADLHEVNTDVQDTTLILVRFDPIIETTSDEVKIASEYFSWAPLDAQSSSFSPYQLYFYGAEVFGFAYKPTLAIDFSHVSQLTLHLEGSGSSGPVKEIDVELWNVETEAWVKISGINWGDNQIQDAQQFVKPDGTIQMQLRGLGQYVNFTRADFSLLVLMVDK